MSVNDDTPLWQVSFRIHPWGGLDDVPEGPLLTGQNGSFELEAA